MSHPYVCTTCRLQIVLRRTSQSLYWQRRWLSQTARTRQGRTVKGLASDRRNEFERSRPREQLNRESPHVQARGRYSGKPLHPQELLEQLSGTEVRAPGSTRRVPDTRHSARHQNAPVQRLHTTKSQAIEARTAKAVEDDLHPRLKNLYERFSDAQKEHDDRAALEILRQISLEPTRDEFVHWGQFQRWCFFLVQRIRNRWFDRLKVREAPPQDMPRPFEGISLVTACTNRIEDIYPSTLWQLAAAAVKLRPSIHPHTRGLFSICMGELMASWNLVMRVKMSAGIDHLATGASLDWSFLPSPDAVAERLQRERADVGGIASFEHQLSMFLAGDRPKPAKAAEADQPGAKSYEYSSAALVTSDLLRRMEPEFGFPSLSKAFEPWMGFMDQVLQGVKDTNAPRNVVQKLETRDNPDYYRELVARLISQGFIPAISDANDRSTTTGPAPLTVQKEQETLPSGEGAENTASTLPNKLSMKSQESTPALRLTSDWDKRLGRALEQQDLSEAHDVYRDVQAFVNRHPNTLLLQELYENLLYTFLSLRSPKPTISIWNDMIKAGHRPTTKTYTIMMRGSQSIPDHSVTMEQFWQRMRQAGLQPDHNAWTTRIFGMLKSRVPADVAFKAMDEMGHEWEAAARAALPKKTSPKWQNKDRSVGGISISELLTKFPGNVNGVPKPDITVMNCALSGLAIREDFLIPKVLSWGRIYGIKPDLIAYNVLLNIAMRKGLPDEALKMLRRMSVEGIEPDSTTWTVLLSAMFAGDSLAGLTAEEVEQRILDFLKNIDDMPGPGLDEKGYAIIVDRLLKTYDNASGAQKVLDHMTSKGMKPNAPMFSILMTSYFQKSPPDFAAVDALWARIENDNDGRGAVLDAEFYDRMIEAYAQYHNIVGTQKMLTLLESMEKQGKKPSWKALDFVARALVEAGQTSKLTQIVQRAAQERRSPTEKANFGEREFWRFLDSVGIRRDDYPRR